MQYEGKHYKREYKHLKQEPKKRRRGRTPLVMLIAVELILTAAASVTAFSMSWDRITDKRSLFVTASVEDFSTKSITADVGRFYKKSLEQVAEKVDEEMWTTESINYRTGPGTYYDTAGTLNSYSKIQRVGITYNDWSQVVVDGEEYFVSSEFLTDEVPLVTATGAKGEYQRYALSQLANYGWDETEILPLIELWNRESGWNPNAHNGGSGAHGIPQALPASKMASEGSDYYTNGNTQIRWGLGYISGRYGSPSNAWAHFRSHGWY